MKTVISMPSAQIHEAGGRGEAAEIHTPSATSIPPVAFTGHSAFVPVLLSGLALLGWFGFQTLQLLQERDSLQTAHASQQLTVDSASKLRGSLDALAADTQRVADAGNPNAMLLVDELRKRGITINPAAALPTKPSGP